MKKTNFFQDFVANYPFGQFALAFGVFVSIFRAFFFDLGLSVGAQNQCKNNLKSTFGPFGT